MPLLSYLYTTNSTTLALLRRQAWASAHAPAFIVATTFTFPFCPRCLPQELLRLIPRFSSVALVQPILPVHDHVVANIIHLWVIGAIRLDIDILKRPIETRRRLAAVDLYDSLAIGVPGKVFEVDVGPLERAGVGVQACLVGCVGEAMGQ